MTDPRRVLRPRRRPTLESIPDDLVRWFSGEVPADDAPWSALLPPDYRLLPARWAVFAEAHPGARPPAGYEWLDDPDSPQQPSPERVRGARR